MRRPRSRTKRPRKHGRDPPRNWVEIAEIVERQRFGVTVHETSLRYRDFEKADEIFSSGNYSKVMPVNRIGERSLQPGPLYRQARELYWDYAHA